MSIAISVDQLALRTTVACTTVLLGKFYLSLFKQGITRFAVGSRAPEDGAVTMLSKGKVQNFNSGEADDKAVKPHHKEAEQRWLRIVQNDLENIPFGLLVGWAGLLTGGTSAHSTLFTVFTACRILHTVFYAAGVQPWRAIAFSAGVFSVAGMTGLMFQRVMF